MYFGKKDYYRLSTDECEPLVDCSEIVVNGRANEYQRDDQINKCVSKVDGSVYTYQDAEVESSTANATTQSETCGPNSHLDSSFDICVCDEGWFKDFETGECSQKADFQAQTSASTVSSNKTMEEQQLEMTAKQTEGYTKIIIKCIQIVIILAVVFGLVKLLKIEYQIQSKEIVEPDWEEEERKWARQREERAVARKSGYGQGGMGMGSAVKKSIILNPQTLQSHLYANRQSIMLNADNYGTIGMIG